MKIKFTHIIFAFLGFVLLATPALADDLNSDDEQRAEKFVNETVVEFIAILQNSTDRAQREQGFRDLLAERANMRRIAGFTLGQFRRTISKEDFVTFQQLINEVIIRVYANRLGAYSNEKVKVLGTRAKGKNFIVSSKIIFTDNQEPIGVDWWLRKEKTGAFKLFDVRVLGVWMAQEQRASFTSILKNNKGDMQALFRHLRQQLEQPKATTQKTSG